MIANGPGWVSTGLLRVSLELHKQGDIVGEGDSRGRTAVAEADRRRREDWAPKGVGRGEGDPLPTGRNLGKGLCPSAVGARIEMLPSCIII